MTGESLGRSVRRAKLGWNLQQWYLQGSELGFCHLDIPPGWDFWERKELVRKNVRRIGD